MPDPVLQVERRDHVVVLRLHRPKQMNALNGELLLALSAEVKKIRDDRSVHALVITGNPRLDGRPCFSAGDDLKEAASGQAPPGNPGGILTNLIDDLLTPSIAVIDGVCTTGALEIAMACDLRVVADTAQISDWHLARLGSGLGGWGASTRLARLVGVAQAKDLILTGKVIDGIEAHRIGLAQRVVPSAELWDHSMQLADTIATMNPNGVRMTMAHLARVQDLSKEESLAYAKQIREWFAPTRTLADATSGVLDAHRRANRADG
jgi:enoyl-CoA hydratase/carnithine racemase